MNRIVGKINLGNSFQFEIFFVEFLIVFVSVLKVLDKFHALFPEGVVVPGGVEKSFFSAGVGGEVQEHGFGEVRSSEELVCLESLNGFISTFSY